MQFRAGFVFPLFFRVLRCPSWKKALFFPQLTSTPQAPAAAPAAPAAPAAAPAAPAGGIEITAGAAGKVFKIDANVGQQVKAGDTVIIIEAMKMEIPQVAPQDGTIASIVVSAGDPVEAGTLMATMN